MCFDHIAHRLPRSTSAPLPSCQASFSTGAVFNPGATRGNLQRLPALFDRYCDQERHCLTYIPSPLGSQTMTDLDFRGTMFHSSSLSLVCRFQL